MRVFLMLAAGAVLVVGALAVALRLPSVEDALFDRALADKFAPKKIDLFDDDGLKVFFCGTGSPLPSLKRAQGCTGIIFGNRIFLVDAGSGSWERIQAAGIPGQRLGGVFLTHLHSDHIGDLGEVNLGSWIGARYAPLRVFGPAGVERVVAGFNEAYALDTTYRTAHHGEGVAPTGTAGMEAHAFDASAPYIVFAESGFIATAFPVHHDPVSPAVGYKFVYKGRTVVVSGDTAFTESVIEHAKDADVLVHEAQANHMVAKMSEAAKSVGNINLAKILDDIPSYHTSPVDAARVANEAGAEWLVLTHLTPAPDNEITRRIFLRGAEEARSKNVKLAEDGMLILLPEAGGVVFTKY
ncbi:MAG: MBL fold metallo-hydrolase [Parvularculaceae bacterium]